MLEESVLQFWNLNMVSDGRGSCLMLIEQDQLSLMF